jgi:hypothetical protein
VAKPKEFSKRMRKIAASIEVNSSNTAKKAALAIDAQVVVATPVDTGRARANWLVGIDAPKTQIENDFQEGKGGSSAASVTSEALSKAKFEILKKRPGQIIFISNNLNYISDLNRGTSAQAPAGFVETAIVAGVQAVKGAKILGKVSL